MKWVVLDTGVNSAEENMRIDADLLARAETLQSPCLHLYEWKRPSITYGHFVKPERFLQMERVEDLGWETALRPTGGGIVLHAFDFAFSLVVPAHTPWFSTNTLDNYRFVNGVVLQVCKQFLQARGGLSLTPEDRDASVPSSSFCMARPTKYDVILQGKKIAGAAQRKTKCGFLHQGTIALVLPDREVLSQILLPETDVIESMFKSTFPLLTQAKEKEQKEAREVLKHLLTVHLTDLPLQSALE